MHGVEVIKQYVKTLPAKPGVYRMLSAEGDVLYVGKAKSLRNRVPSYTRPEGLTIRLQRMVHLTTSMEFVLTKSEAEALILEATLIKKFQPPYNVLLKDDKAYPYILLTKGGLPSRMVVYRGMPKKDGDYFGPFASVSAVHQTLEMFVRSFKLRTCKDTVYRHRKRPCLQYHIKRCTAPCVGKISLEDYDKNVEQVRGFLQGKNRDIQKTLATQMKWASDQLDYEQAAMLRDQIQALNKVQEEHGIRLDQIQETDIIALVKDQGMVAVQVFFFRHGLNYGNQAYFPIHTADASEETVLENFLVQFYLNKPVPKEILVNLPVAANVHAAIEEKAGRKVALTLPQRGEKKPLVSMAEQNAREALAMRLAERSSQKKLLEGVQKLFDLKDLPERIEVYDNSHHQGKAAYGGMIVADGSGFDKKSYRRFLIKNAKQQDLPQGGDDYAMMEEVLTRRFSNKSLPRPSLVLLDGGKGQLSVGQKVFDALGIDVPLVAISKGVDRNAGRETFHQVDKEEFQLPKTDPVLYYLQRLRDEAHRYAIGTHRKGHQKSTLQSALEDIDGIGAKRRRALLQHFGSLKDIKDASVESLEQAEGISQKIAQQIYTFFHS